MAAETSRSSTSSADSYIGSLISLTSKSEIRYEGILYNINTEESSIGLRNVRSFGSEGRKKDGPQIMPSDKVYEYILFRGSDIKDLQVKTSVPAQHVQPTQPINNDPAIIQSHYPWPAPPSLNLPAATISNSMPGLSTHNPQVGPNGPNFQGGMPLYQPDGTMGSWGPSPPPPNVNSSGLSMPPMYWPGFYAPPNGLPHQQSLFRPTTMQYPGFTPSLPNGPPNLSDYSTSSANLTTSSSLLTSSLPSGLPPVPPLLSSTEPLPNLLQTKVPNSLGSTALPPASLTTVASATTSPDVNETIPPVSNKSNGLPGVSPTPPLVTPGQLLQSGVQVVHKDVELAAPAPAPKPAPKPAPSSERSAPAPAPAPTTTPPTPASAQAPKPAAFSEPSAPVSDSTESQPPILPLPTQNGNPTKTNGGPYQNRNSYRGRERGRGSGGSRPVMKFTEEFDFTAMNEKFNKDEVWGTLGKSRKSNSKERDGDASDEDEFEDEYDASALPKIDVKPVYSKDDFFDTLSCNSNDNRSNNGRTRFSEQMKLDTETFGEFSRYRGGGWGGRGPYRGGRSRGGGYRGRGYGYVSRARGGRNPTSDY